MKFRIGTYNLENLFDRFDDPYSVGDDSYGLFRTKPKSRGKLFDCGRRIRENGVKRNNPVNPTYPIDIVGLQEIENFGALLDFVQASVGPDYGAKSGVLSLPSNDPRGIDLGLIVRTDVFRVGRIISHRFKKFRRSDGKLYQFGRDCLQVEILHKDTSQHFMTIFNCHLKSKFTRANQFKDPVDYEKEQQLNSIKRRAEAEEIVRIVKSAVDVEQDFFVVLGDLNDTPGSDPLQPLVGPDNELKLTNAVSLLEQENPAETSKSRRARDTHHWERPISEDQREDEWAQLDYLLVSKKLWEFRTGVVDVVNSPQNQGSDHYLSFAEFDISDD